MTAAPANRPVPARFAFHHGEFVPFEQARLPVTTQGLHYGTGVFEGIRAYATADGGLALFRLVDHYRRFLRSCAALRIDPGHDVAELCEITVELLRRNECTQDTYVRPLAYKLSLLPGTPPGVGLAGVSDGLSIVVSALGSYAPANGLSCAIGTWRKPRADTLPAQAKITAGYATGALAADEARAAGHHDAILLTADGRVAEATTANLFAVDDGRLRTPPVSTGVLAGITRATVFDLAAELGLPAAEADLCPADLLVADEVFLTGTGLGVVPVVRLAGRAVGDGAPGPVTTRLARAYERVVRGGHPRSRQWSTRVGRTEGQ